VRLFSYLVLFSLFPSVLPATSIVRVSLEEAVAQSEWIVSGDVTRTWSGWDSGHRFIWTHAEIAVRERWKGDSGPTITVSEPGGAVGDFAMQIAGMVRYSLGEHVIVFLYRTPIGLIRTVGLAQGKLLIDSRGLVHPSASDALVVSTKGAQPAGTSISKLDSLTVSAAHNRISRMAAAAPEVHK
jgi:hypothetical protein